MDSLRLSRERLSRALSAAGIEVVGTTDVGSCLEALAGVQPDVVLIDPFGQATGLEAITQVSSAAPDSRVLVLTGTNDHHLAAQAIMAGASGYVLKGAPWEEIISAIKASAAGDGVICVRVAAELLEPIRTESADPSDRGEARAIRAVLTSRELEILRRIAAGRTNLEIAHALSLSEYTVKNHVASILEKLELDNRVQAAVGAVRSGIA